ncbi:hypothetical protein FUAX_09770 [Fulvitalea axinellae]|uniref:Peptidoglycan domain protein n=1 Tax=Fulvitalea axinellae TaxID=1182444 RepID=A0AAU9DCH4_9BACT|nr:hypothetical protein FUAX_09770 [Fulvitalea axinellae]
MSFDRAHEIAMKHEGFYANNPNDKGGETYRGIARNYHPGWEGWALVDAEKRRLGVSSLKTNQRINSPTLDSLVKAFYRVKFWRRGWFDKFADSSLAIQAYDFYINAGGNAVKVLQRVLNDSFGFSLAVDGAMGRNTVNAVNSVPGSELFEAFKQGRIAYYKRIAKGSNAGFLPGWLKRASMFNYAGGISAVALLAIFVGLWLLNKPS